MVDFDKRLEDKGLDLERKLILVDEILIKEKERNLIVSIFFNLESIIPGGSKTDMAIGLELEVGPFGKLFPELEKSRFVEFGIGAQDLLKGVDMGLVHVL